MLPTQSYQYSLLVSRAISQSPSNPHLAGQQVVHETFFLELEFFEVLFFGTDAGFSWHKISPHNPNQLSTNIPMDVAPTHTR